MVLILVFGSIFLVIVSGFIGSVIAQSQVVNFRYEQQRATDIAEAGLNYYKWYLAHNPGDLTGGGTFTYEDPELGPIGSYELTVAGQSYCGQISSINVQSRGWTDVDPGAAVTISATYKQPTVAEYSFINNAGVRYGSSRVITGPVHGNQWVQMDGAHNSFVGSGIATYDNSGTTVGGVFQGSPTNSTPSLFVYPIEAIDFTGLTVDLANIRTLAQADGFYYGPTTGAGYRLIFNGDGTVDIYRVTTTTNYWSYSSTEGWHRGERNHINNTSQLADDLVLGTDCPVLFFEDKLWIEGEVTQKVTVAAGLNTSNTQNNVVISGDVTYASTGDPGLVAVAEDDVDVGISVPNDMTINGIFIAQNGRFGRNHYCESDCSDDSGNQGLPGTLDEYVSRDSLTRLGSVISNLRGGTEWSSGSTHSSGFRSRVTAFDRNQVDNPPPLTPITNDVYELQDWRLEQ